MNIPTDSLADVQALWNILNGEVLQVGKLST